MLPRGESDWAYNGPFSTLAEIHAFQIAFGVAFAVASPWEELTAVAAATVGLDSSLSDIDDSLVAQMRKEAHYALSGIVAGTAAGLYVSRRWSAWRAK